MYSRDITDIFPEFADITITSGMRFEENIFITFSETEIFQILYNDYLQLQNFNVQFSKYCLNEDLNFA